MPEAENVTEFENVMLEERCAIKEIPADRWHFEDFYHSEPQVKDTTVYPRWPSVTSTSTSMLDTSIFPHGRPT